MTATLTASRVRRPKSSPRCVWCPVGMTLDLTASDAEPRIYSVEERDHRHGRLFRLDKATVGSDPTADGYDVLLGYRPSQDSCGCRGFRRWARCSHVEAMRHLTALGVDFTPALADVPSEAELDEMCSAMSNGACGSAFDADIPDCFAECSVLGCPF